MKNADHGLCHYPLHLPVFSTVQTRQCVGKKTVLERFRGRGNCITVSAWISNLALAEALGNVRRNKSESGLSRAFVVNVTGEGFGEGTDAQPFSWQIAVPPNQAGTIGNAPAGCGY